jgi:hypothetical protein
VLPSPKAIVSIAGLDLDDEERDTFFPKDIRVCLYAGWRNIGVVICASI